MTNELAIRILTGDVLGTASQTSEAIKTAVKALSMPSAQPEEAISVAWLEEQAKWFESMDNAFAKIEANNIRVMIKKYRSEKNE